jgi:hypothetical protein
MERSSQDSSVRTVCPVPPKNLKKNNAADANFLLWFQDHQPALSLDEEKKIYVEEVNVRRKAKYAKHLEEHQSYLDSLKNFDQIPNPTSADQSPPLSRLTTLSKSTIKNRLPPQNIFSQSFPPRTTSPRTVPPRTVSPRTFLPPERSTSP